MQETGRTVMLAEKDAPPAIRNAVRRQIAEVYAAESGKIGITVTPEDVMAKFEAADRLSLEAEPASAESGATTPADPSVSEPSTPTGKNPKRVAAAKEMWKTRPRSQKKRQSSGRKLGLTGGHLAFHTRLERYMDEHPEYKTREEAKAAMLKPTIEARARSLEQKKAAAEAARQHRSTRGSGRPTKTTASRPRRQTGTASAV